MGDQILLFPEMQPRFPRRLRGQLLGWVAGLIEGEGCIQMLARAVSVSVVVKMTDQDVVSALHQRTGLGRVCGPYRSPSAQPHWKPQWDWYVGRREEVHYLLTSIAPLMGSRRRAKIEAALRSIATAKPPAKTHCKRGHPLEGDNVYLWRNGGGRSCRACHALRKRERHAAGRLVVTR